MPIPGYSSGVPYVLADGSASRVGEGAYVTFTVSLSEASSQAVSVGYMIRGGTALVGSQSDIRSEISTIRFNPQETSKTVQVYVDQDVFPEPDESFVLELINPDGATFRGDQSVQAIGWIRDDDGGTSVPQVFVSSPTVVEATGQEAEFIVSLSRPFGTATTFDVATIDGSALAGPDYTALTDKVTFAAGQTEARVRVAVRDDLTAEPAESFGLKVSGPGGQAAVGWAEILDNDATQPVVSVEGSFAKEGDYLRYLVRLSEPLTQSARISYVFLSDSAVIGSDARRENSFLTFSPGQTTRVVDQYLPVSSDPGAEPDESLRIEVYNPVGATLGGYQTLSATGWVHDDNSGGALPMLDVSDPVIREAAGRSVEFVLSLSRAFDSETTLAYSTVAGSAQAGSDFAPKSGQVTFSAGQTEARVIVPLLNDSLIEASESFGLRVAGSASVGDTGWATIDDDDSQLPLVTVEGDAGNEGDYVFFRIRLSQPATQLTIVSYSTVAGSAAAGTDFRVESNTVTFNPGESVKTVNIYLPGDGTVEPDETFFLEVTNVNGASFGLDPKPRGTGWIHDDDSLSLTRALSVTGSEGAERVAAGANRATFAVEISEPVGQRMTFTYATVDGTATAGADYVRSQGSIVFEPNQTRAYVSVPLIADLALEDTESFDLRVQSTNQALFASGQGAVTGTARIRDSSIPGGPLDDTLTGTALPDGIYGQDGNDTLFGLGGGDVLSGGQGNDRLTGGLGNDAMIGGPGNDSYNVDAGGDRVIEQPNQGTDLVFSTVSYVLPANVENLTLSGTAIRGAGNNLANFIRGNAQANVLNGLAGNDRLDGALGADVMAGGPGNDSYVVENAGDQVSEAANAGIDTIFSSISFRLGANVENLTLFGGLPANGIGNGLNNAIRGNAAKNVLSGGAGHDRLDGSGGADEMYGGPGNDTYVVDHPNDRVAEAPNAGVDTVVTTLAYALGANLENLTLIGGASVRGTGNGLNNALTGNSGNNLLNGGAGADRMAGGAGNDTYIVDSARDKVIEAVGAGIDRIQATVSQALSANVEHLSLVGGANLNGNGNGLANAITGNAGNNVLSGGAGNDVLRGGAGLDRLIGGPGADLLTGGAQRDLFVYAAANHSGRGAAHDRITDFQKNVDTLDLRAVDANVGAGGNQDFRYIGTANFTGHVGDLRVQHGLVQGDVNGDLIADFEIVLGNNVLLGVHDILV